MNLRHVLKKVSTRLEFVGTELLLQVFARLSGCRADGSLCVKDTPDCNWSVAFSNLAVADGRHVWEARVRGRTGRMSIGVAKCVDDVLRPTGAGWVSPSCEGNVWYYSSTGSLRDGPKLIQETVRMRMFPQKKIHPE